MASTEAAPDTLMEVRVRPSFPGFQKTLAGVLLASTAAMFVVGGLTRPGSFGGILFIVVGLLCLVFCVVSGLRAAGTLVSRRPALILDAEGIRAPRPWPLPRGTDQALAWSDLAVVCAWTHGPPSGGRGAAMSRPQLSFLPVRPATLGPDSEHAPRPLLESGAELLATKVAELSCVATLRWTVSIRPGWDHPVEQVIAQATRHRADVPVVDRRELPKPRPKPRPLRRPKPGDPAE